MWGGDGVGFHANIVAGLREAFREAVEDYIETCARIGKEPQKTYSGQVMFQVSPDVHRKVALAAELCMRVAKSTSSGVVQRTSYRLPVDHRDGPDTSFCTEVFHAGRQADPISNRKMDPVPWRNS